MSNATVKAALCELKEEEIKEFFEEHFTKPIISQLETNPAVSAEILRTQLIQTKKILNILLTFRSK